MKNELSDIAKSMVEDVGCPYTFYPADDKEAIVNGYVDALRRGETDGFIPVIVAVDDILTDQLGILADDGYCIGDILGKDAADGAELLRDRYNEYFGECAPDDAVFAEYGGRPEHITGLYCLDNASDGVIIFEIPTRKPWEVAAYIPFGGWNDCPCAEDMMAVLKYWYEKFGAVPVAITHDTLEMSVPAPVGADAADALAREHCAFTPDRVWQCTGSGSFAEVAASLAVSPVWFFWWD